jgi:hypothetical protein
MCAENNLYQARVINYLVYVRYLPLREFHPLTDNDVSNPIYQGVFRRKDSTNVSGSDNESCYGTATRSINVTLRH